MHMQLVHLRQHRKPSSCVVLHPHYSLSLRLTTFSSPPSTCVLHLSLLWSNNTNTTQQVQDSR